MAKKITYKFEQIEDGEVVEMKEGEPLTVACCDCGLTHDLTVVRLANQRGPRKVVRVRFQVNDEDTEATRRQMKRKAGRK